MKRKNILGIDIGQNRLKLVLVSGGVVKKTVAAEMPDGVFKDGRLEHVDMVADLIKETMKEAKIRVPYAALAISSDNTYIKHIDIPVMTADQLKKNLPYEFNDFIDGDPNNFVFDYVTVDTPEDEVEEEPAVDENGEALPEEAKRMNLLGVAASKEYIDRMNAMLHRAGLRMAIAAPELSAYAALIALRGDRVEVPGGEFAFVDLGYRRIQLYMFKYDTFMTSRELEWGISDVVSCIAEEMGVDVYTAHSYLEANYENCQGLESVQNRFDLITVELKRSLDFYRFSNPDSQLRDIWIIGGGSYITPLINQITSELDDIVIHSTEELLPELEPNQNRNLYLKAAGIAMNQ